MSCTMWIVQLRRGLRPGALMRDGSIPTRFALGGSTTTSAIEGRSVAWVGRL
jgi:hypothetical protein